MISHFNSAKLCRLLRVVTDYGNKSLPICIFLELPPGSESLVGINAVTWNMTEERNFESRTRIIPVPAT